MTLLERVAGAWFAVLDLSAQGAAALTARVSGRQRVRAVERGGDLVFYPDRPGDAPPLGRLAADGTATTGDLPRRLRRSLVTLDLDPARFLFRTLDLPDRARDFVASIVGTQIDRLTPWKADQVMFGWDEPHPAGADGKIAVTVAATNRAFVAPLLGRIEACGAGAIVARVVLPPDHVAPGPEAATALVVARTAAAGFAVAFWRRVLGIATAAVVSLVIGSSLYAQYTASGLTDEAERLDRQLAAKRALVAKAVNGNDPALAARRSLQQRKREVPSATLVLDAATRLLPDHTFVTDFEIAGNRLRLVGFTADAPTLVRLFEKSDMFAAPGFFAPTTRLPEDPADRFSLEATVRPGVGLAP